MRKIILSIGCVVLALYLASAFGGASHALEKDRVALTRKAVGDAAVSLGWAVQSLKIERHR